MRRNAIIIIGSIVLYCVAHALALVVNTFTGFDANWLTLIILLSVMGATRYAGY